MAIVEGSILQGTKKALGLDPEAVGFDPELIIHINSVLSDFTQLGIGPDAGYAITDDTQTWVSFMGSNLRYNSAQSLLFLRVKLLFDPPTTGYVLTSYEKAIEKAEWRLNIAREEIIHPAIPYSGVAVMNPLERDGVVRISGGRVESVNLDGIAIGDFTQPITVLSGQIITVTYSDAPTWVWT